MTIERIYNIIENEFACVIRNDAGKCNRDCANCDLLMDTNDIIKAYTDTLHILKRVRDLRQYDPPYPSVNKVFEHWWNL